MCIVLGVIEPFIDFDTQSLLFYLRFYLIYIYIYIYMFLHIGWTTFSKSFLTYIVKFRILIDFQYNKAMGNVMHFEIFQCYKRALCEISDANLEFTIIIFLIILGKGKILIKCVLLFWFVLFCKMNCVCVGIV